MEKVKEEKKRKEKKGMLSGLFKRKDKKIKDDAEDSLLGDTQPFKDSSESLVPEGKQGTKSIPHEAQKNSLEETQASKGAPQQPQRQSSKLHKAQPMKQPPSGKLPPRSENPSQKVAPKEKAAVEPRPDKAPFTVIEGVSVPPTSQSKDSSAPDSMISSEGKDSVQSRLDENRKKESSEFPVEDLPPCTSKSETPKEVLHETINPASDSPPPHSRAEKLKTPQERMPLEGYDSSPDTEKSPPSLVAAKIERPPQAKVEASQERLSESPVQVDVPPHSHSQHMPPQSHSQHTPPLITDDSPREELNPSPRSPTSTPELIDAPFLNDREGPIASADQSLGNTPIWSDASLRAYLEDGSDIRDLLILVHHKPDPKPTDPDHPIVKTLFQAERRQLREISDELDSLLMNYRARKAKMPNQ